MRAELICEPANVRTKQGRPPEQRIKIEPEVAVVAGRQVEVAALRTC
jgi:hypothetical protein